MYKVTRHGGRRSDKERILYEGDIIKEAYSIFDDVIYLNIKGECYERC